MEDGDNSYYTDSYTSTPGGMSDYPDNWWGYLGGPSAGENGVLSYGGAYTPSATSAPATAAPGMSALDRFLNENRGYTQNANQNLDSMMSFLGSRDTRADTLQGKTNQQAQDMSMLGQGALKSGPITMTQYAPGMYKPSVITGGMAGPATIGLPQNQQNIQNIIDAILARIGGSTSGSVTSSQGVPFDKDAYLASLLADINANETTNRNRMDQRFAGLGRSVTGSVPTEYQGNLAADAERNRLAARAQTEQLGITAGQAGNQYNVQLMTLLPQLVRLLSGQG